MNSDTSVTDALDQLTHHFNYKTSDENGKPPDVVDFDCCERKIGGTNVILYGVPGSGKSTIIEKEYCTADVEYQRIVFHPEYSSADFIGQLMPDSTDGKISYPFCPGPLTSAIKDAYRDPDREHILIIEEINRGNAAAIFGDVFQLLDRDDEGNSKFPTNNRDMALCIYGTSKHPVTLPSNLTLLATMNTSDQNVFVLDTAFQRRWEMRLIRNDIRAVSYKDTPILDTSISWGDFNTKVNEQILSKNESGLSSEDKRLGVYFIKETELRFNADEDSPEASSLQRARAIRQNSRFSEKILKYLWDDAFRYSRDQLFDIERFGSLEAVVQSFNDKRGNQRFDVFNHAFKSHLGLFAN